MVTLNLVEAQLIKKKEVHAQIEYGVNAPLIESNINSDGFFAQNEFVLKDAFAVRIVFILNEKKYF